MAGGLVEVKKEERDLGEKDLHVHGRYHAITQSISKTRDWLKCGPAVVTHF